MSHADPKSLLGASIPRSGHHFLQTMLKAYFGRELQYCEVYKQTGCCRQVPCTRRGAFAIMFQKSHDFDMALPRDVAEATYLVQYRHPVPQALSDRELELREHIGILGLEFRKTREHYMAWLAKKAVYYRNFHDKWMVSRVPGGIYLDYADLSRAPAEALGRIILALSAEPDAARIDEVVAQVSGVRVGTREPTAFRPRVPEESPHFDRDLLGAFEDYVVARTPEFGYGRMIPEGRIADHPMRGLILAQDENEPLPPGRSDRLRAAIEIAGDHPGLMMRLAKREADRGNHAAAILHLRGVLERFPGNTQAWWPLLVACRAAGEPAPPEMFRAETLLNLTRRPELLVHAGELLLQAGQLIQAMAALSIATTLLPENAKAQRLMARALEAAGRRPQARPFAERAATLEAAQLEERQPPPRGRPAGTAAAASEQPRQG